MNKTTKLQSAHDGAFLVNDTAANDPAVQSAMASYLESLKAETRRRQAIREGRLPAPEGQWGNWNISDRD